MKNLSFYSIILVVSLLSFACKSADSLDIKMSNSRSQKVENVNKIQSPIEQNEEKQINLETSYKNYFENNAKCYKSDDKNRSKDSPCLININFNSNGEATKTSNLERKNLKRTIQQSISKH
jgi:hypothetical protein